MGERATIQVVNSETGEFSPIAYVHWHGPSVLETIVKAAPFLRRSDVDYAFARLAGHLHNLTGGDTETLSFGVYNAEAIVTDGSHNDWGHYQLDLATRGVFHFHNTRRQLMATVELSQS